MYVTLSVMPLTGCRMLGCIATLLLDMHIWEGVKSEQCQLGLAAVAVTQQRWNPKSQVQCKADAAGLQQRARQEPSFARAAPGFGNRGAQGGDFIVRGADGRGGRAKVLKPHNRLAASAQVLCLLCMSLRVACAAHHSCAMHPDSLCLHD